MSGAHAGRGADKETDKGRVAPAVVRRYWPGRAPDWVKDQAPEQESDEEEKEQEVVRTEVAAPVILKKADDPRLARLAQTQGRAADDSDSETAEGRHRHISTAQVLSRRRRGSSESDESEASDEEEGKGEEEEDEEELEARRAAVREKLKKRQQQEEELLGEGDEEEEESEEGSSEYETDSDDEEYGRQMLKPVFVPKKERETIAEREAMLKEEEAEFEKNKQRLEERKTETKELVLERIKLDEATARSAKEGPKELGDIDTDDDKDEEVEYEQWKSREMRRIRRERDAKETEAREAEEREMFKKMSAEERAQWERDHPKEVDKAPRKNLKFLQKYWHQGAFFQQASDTNPSEKQVDGIYRRDFSAPTGEDKMDKTVLPKIMQVKNFGRRGRTKYTHLVDQDTTEFDNPLEPDAALRAKYEKKMAGTKDVFAAPKHTR